MFTVIWPPLCRHRKACSSVVHTNQPAALTGYQDHTFLTTTVWIASTPIEISLGQMACWDDRMQAEMMYFKYHCILCHYLFSLCHNNCMTQLRMTPLSCVQEKTFGACWQLTQSKHKTKSRNNFMWQPLRFGSCLFLQKNLMKID